MQQNNFDDDTDVEVEDFCEFCTEPSDFTNALFSCNNKNSGGGCGKFHLTCVQEYCVEMRVQSSARCKACINAAAKASS